jgi:hypothetical protein
MPQQQRQEWGNRESFNLIAALVNFHATAITPIGLRIGFGKEALGVPGLGAFVLILIVAGFNGSQSMLDYLGVWFCAVACQRAYTFRLIRRGVVWHSRYEGWPELAVKLARGNVKGAVLVVEPLIVAAVGYVFQDMGERVVGTFLMTGAFSLFVRELIHRQINDRRLMAMSDAQIEQEDLAHAYRRQGRGEDR